MNAEKKCYMVWNGYAWWETFAVSERQAMSNIEYRMRKRGMFPLRAHFDVELKDKMIAGSAA